MLKGLPTLIKDWGNLVDDALASPDHPFLPSSNAGDTTGSKTDRHPCPRGAYILGEDDSKQVKKMCGPQGMGMTKAGSKGMTGYREWACGSLEGGQETPS